MVARLMTTSPASPVVSKPLPDPTINNNANAAPTTPDEPRIVTEDVVKIVMLGGEQVGITSIIRRYLHHCFTSTHSQTIGVDISSNFVDRSFSDKVGNPVLVQFWDVSYRELRGRHVGRYLKGANGIIMVFDVTDLKSVQAVDQWRLLIEQHFAASGLINGERRVSSLSLPARGYENSLRHQRPPMILLANKNDMGRTVIKPSDLDVYVKKCGYKSWHSTSARTGENVSSSIGGLIEQVVDQVAYEKLAELCQRSLADNSRRNLKPPTLVNVTNFGSPTREGVDDAFFSNHSQSPPSTVTRSNASTVSSTHSSIHSTSNGKKHFGHTFRLDDPETNSVRSVKTIINTAPSLRELENKGNDFYLRLEEQLQHFFSHVSSARRIDLQLLESQRVNEYLLFKRRFLEAANQVANFDDLNDFSNSDTSSSINVNVAEQEEQTAHLLSNIQLFLNESALKWRQVLNQLNLEIMIEQKASTSSPSGLDEAGWNTNASPNLVNTKTSVVPIPIGNSQKRLPHPSPTGNGRMTSVVEFGHAGSLNADPSNFRAASLPSSLAAPRRWFTVSTSSSPQEYLPPKRMSAGDLEHLPRILTSSHLQAENSPGDDVMSHQHPRRQGFGFRNLT